MEVVLVARQVAVCGQDYAEMFDRYKICMENSPEIYWMQRTGRAEVTSNKLQLFYSLYNVNTVFLSLSVAAIIFALR